MSLDLAAEALEREYAGVVGADAGIMGTLAGKLCLVGFVSGIVVVVVDGGGRAGGELKGVEEVVEETHKEEVGGIAAFYRSATRTRSRGTICLLSDAPFRAGSRSALNCSWKNIFDPAILRLRSLSFAS